MRWFLSVPHWYKPVFLEGVIYGTDSTLCNCMLLKIIMSVVNVNDCSL